MHRPVITLTTDFGLTDAYVGAMKGVLLGICPGAVLVDLSHEIPPQDVRGAAFVVAAAAPYFPEGTVHLVVVDPGVGSTRRAVAVLTQRSLFVAPDNGVLSLALLQEPVVQTAELANPRYRLPEVSATFHGRDLFAPAAAHLACGTPLQELGPPITDLVTLPWPPPELQADGSLIACVLHVDRFGNLILNVQPGHVEGWPRDQIEFEIAGRQVVGVSRTYADVPSGVPVAYLGSSGYLELGVRDGNAAARWGVGASALVWVGRRAA